MSIDGQVTIYSFTSFADSVTDSEHLLAQVSYKGLSLLEVNQKRGFDDLEVEFVGPAISSAFPTPLVDLQQLLEAAKERLNELRKESSSPGVDCDKPANVILHTDATTHSPFAEVDYNNVRLLIVRRNIDGFQVEIPQSSRGAKIPLRELLRTLDEATSRLSKAGDAP